MIKVYKIVGEAYEITEERKVYTSRKSAILAKDWESFLGMDVEEALSCGEISVEEWELK